jgi:predicted NBD/HSP70 family sugar kinase
VGEILTLFRRSPSLTRADVARLTGLARATVNLRLDSLVNAGLLTPADETVPSARGRPAGRFAFNAADGVLLVADIGATAVRTAVCDLAGQILAEQSTVVDVTTGPDPVLSVVDRAFEHLLRQTGRGAEDVCGIGLDVPGPVDTALGRVISPPIMTGWDRYDIPGWFTQTYNCTVMVEKDVNAMAIGEQRTNHPDVDHLVMLKIGTGVGAGIIAGGGIYRGADGAAGDIGHNPVADPDGADAPLCRCGNQGCAEAYAGGWALVRDLQAKGHDITTVDQALRLLRAGDPEAVLLSRRSGRILGEAISDAVNLLNPRVVVVGGQLARVEQHLIAGIREIVYRRSLPLATRHLEIVTSQLDPRAGIVGLTMLLADHIFDAHRINQLVTS